MGKKRKASEAEDAAPAFISQTNAPLEDSSASTSLEKKKKSKKQEKPLTTANYDPATNTHLPSTEPKPDVSSLSLQELKLKPTNEKKEDKYMRQKELRKRKREEKEKLERLKAEAEGREYIPEKAKKEVKKEKNQRKKEEEGKKPRLSKKEKKLLAEGRKDKKREKRREQKRLERGSDEDAANGEDSKVTITTVEEVKEVRKGDVVEKIEAVKDLVTVEPAGEDKMDIDSASESTSGSEEEKVTKPTAKATKPNKVSNGVKSKKSAKEASKSSSSDSISGGDEEITEDITPKSNGSTTPTTANGTGASTPIDSSIIGSYMTTHSIKITDPEAPDTPPLDLILSFSDLPAIDKSHLSAFSSYKHPTPIQAASWRYLLAGRDLIGVAETGSGKTMAFAYPAVQYLCKLPKHAKNPKKSGAKVVIVSPTRELAMQIYEQLEILTVAAGFKDAATCIYGGVPKDPQRESLKKALVIVATPGRLNDFLEEGAANISGAEYVVLDEADRMLDKGFEDAIKTILSATPVTPKRQTLMFTATWPQSVRQLASTFMTKPVRIGINSPDDGDLRANARISQTVHVLADPRTKESRLLNILNTHQRSSPNAKNDRILVFALYKKEAARLEGFLKSKGIKAGGIHGDLNQYTRTTTLAEFKAGRTPVLVATDVAARGLDIPNVKLVINVTFPLTIEDYVHRIGRTGRAGELGKAITFFTEHDKAHSGSLINVLKAAKQPVPEDLMKFGTTVKKKEHASYGAFYRDTTDAKSATKIKFDD